MPLLSSAVFAGNATDIALTHDHAHNLASLFLDRFHAVAMAIFTFPPKHGCHGAVSL